MVRNIPKNVRQIGNVDDKIKLYIEDYVDTYLNQLCDRKEEGPAGAFLIGETVRQDGEEYRYIHGAIQMEGLRMENGKVTAHDGMWRKSCEVCKTFFEEGEIIGWASVVSDPVLSFKEDLRKIQDQFFKKENSILILKSSDRKEEKIFAGEKELKGHYIYYEKNPSMQNYMVASRKKTGEKSSEFVMDQATKSFRDVVQNKMATQNDKINGRWSYIAATFLILVVMVIGVTTINNYDRMRAVQSSLESISHSIQSEEVQAKENEEGKEEEPAKETSAGSIEEQNMEDTHKYDNNMYIVEKGDTLVKISKKAYGDAKHVDEISEMNGLKNGDLIYVGQKLLLP